ncbi:hypothetical protein B0H19DRAFT_942319, partial [Mycena capillaripes]
VIAFVMDNATNNDTLVEHFAARCRSSGIPFSEENGRMRCMPHIIHLAALQLLKKVGALSDDDFVKACTSLSAYQDSATESTDRTRDSSLVDQLDEDTDEPVNPCHQIRKIVRHVRSSPQRRRQWENVVRILHPDDEQGALMLILDVKTRWSSTHQMLRLCSYIYLQFLKGLMHFTQVVHWTIVTASTGTFAKTALAAPLSTVRWMTMIGKPLSSLLSG